MRNNDDLNAGASKFLSAIYEDINAQRDALAYSLDGGFDEAHAVLTTQDFTDGHYRAVWEAMEAAKADGKVIDFTSVADALEGRIEGDVSVRFQVLGDVMSGDYTASHGRSAVAYLRELSLNRKIQKMLMKAACAAGSKADADKVLSDLMEGTREIQDTLSTSTMPGAIDLSKPIAEPVALVERGSDEVLHLGDLQMIDGKSKSGKSSICTAIAAAVLGGRPSDCLGFAGTMEGSRVMWVDTEQHPRNTMVMARRVLRAAGLPANANCPRFAVLSWRGKTPMEQERLLFRTARQFQPQLIVLDGVTDIVGDFNDIERSTNIVTRLMGLAYELDASILSVLHTNPGGKGAEQKAVGSLGSILYKKVSIEILVTANEDGKDARREVRFLKARNGNPEKFWFGIDENGPYLCTPAPAASTSTAKIRSAMESVFHAGEVLSYSECVKRLVSTGIKERTAKTRISQARADSILLEREGGLYLADDDLPL